jgi:hypothetical protein
MSSRRHLASIADGVARRFEARTNDVDGWWALPLLLEELPSDSDYRLDLVTGEAAPALDRVGLTDLGPAWARYFRWSLERHGVPQHVVSSALLRVSFDRATDVQSWIADGTPDHPHRVVVQITDDRGRVREGVAEGHSSPLSQHVDPNPNRRPRRTASRDAGRVDERMQAE